MCIYKCTLNSVSKKLRRMKAVIKYQMSFWWYWTAAHILKLLLLLLEWGSTQNTLINIIFITSKTWSGNTYWWIFALH